MCKQQKSKVWFYFGLNCELWFPGHVEKKASSWFDGDKFLADAYQVFFQ